jgi:hypothetical protein
MLGIFWNGMVGRSSLVVVQWFEVVVRFCYYWWDCWPSLFKLPFHNVPVVYIPNVVEILCLPKKIRFLTRSLTKILNQVLFLLFLNVRKKYVFFLNGTKFTRSLTNSGLGRFCYYWWDCWPSLFKLPFHNVPVVYIPNVVEILCLLYLFITKFTRSLTNSGLGLWYLTPLSTIFHLYRGVWFYWWRKAEYPEKTIDLPHVTDTHWF